MELLPAWHCNREDVEWFRNLSCLLRAFLVLWWSGAGTSLVFMLSWDLFAVINMMLSVYVYKLLQYTFGMYDLSFTGVHHERAKYWARQNISSK